MAKNQISSISKKYAKALFDTTKDIKDIEFISIELEKVKEVLNSSEDLNLVLNNSSINNCKKVEIIQGIFKEKIDNRVLNFLNILIEKNRIKEFDGICSSYIEIQNQFTNRKSIEIVSSIELNDEYKFKIKSKLEEKLNCEVEPCWKTDESIIAGLIFKFDDYVLDSSVNTKLKNLTKNILR